MMKSVQRKNVWVKKINKWVNKTRENNKTKGEFVQCWRKTIHSNWELWQERLTTNPFLKRGRFLGQIMREYWHKYTRNFLIQKKEKKLIVHFFFFFFYDKIVFSSNLNSIIMEKLTDQFASIFRDFLIDTKRLLDEEYSSSSSSALRDGFKGGNKKVVDGYGIKLRRNKSKRTWKK